MIMNKMIEVYMNAMNIPNIASLKILMIICIVLVSSLRNVLSSRPILNKRYLQLTQYQSTIASFSVSSLLPSFFTFAKCERGLLPTTNKLCSSEADDPGKTC